MQESVGASLCLDLIKEERTVVLNELFPDYIVKACDKLIYGDTWEEKLYIGIRQSKLSSIMYTINVLILRFISLFSRQRNWVDDFPFNKNKK